MNNNTYGNLPTPSRNDYTFCGWFTAESGGTQVSANTMMGAGNTTIYAQWRYILTTTHQCPYNSAVDVSGSNTITVTLNPCGEHFALGGWYSNAYFTSVSVGSSSNQNDLGEDWTWTMNAGASITVDVSAYSTVYVHAGVRCSNDNGESWQCANCTVTIQRY